jgi:cytoplasmic iron level regulating protein YaaA (DUF328/UPF0246 family)
MQHPLTILLHSSKTMRSVNLKDRPLRQPQLINQSKRLDTYLKTLSPKQLMQIMHISAPLADKTHALIAAWGTEPDKQSLALDSFVGDIYSGLQASELTPDDRDYADQTLRILSGLYGIIRPYDAICPYRLEMGYRFPAPEFANLYKYWGGTIAACLPSHGPIVNVSSAEYTQTILPFVASDRIITPKFLTIDPRTNEPAFVVVHAKIARGAFARWLITSRITDSTRFSEFNDLGYRFNRQLSTPDEPVFVCKTFDGIGLSMRLEK